MNEKYNKINTSEFNLDEIYSAYFDEYNTYLVFILLSVASKDTWFWEFAFSLSFRKWKTYISYILCLFLSLTNIKKQFYGE